MYQAVTAPSIRRIRSTFRRWEPSEVDSEDGLGHVIERSLLEAVPSDTIGEWESEEDRNDYFGGVQVIERLRWRALPYMDSPSVVPDDDSEWPLSEDAAVYFDRWLVREGESVWHGSVLAEVTVHGVIIPVTSYLTGYVVGLVDWQEGDRILPGEIMANLATRFDQGSKKTGLNPKPSAAMYFKRVGHFRVY